MPAQKIKPARTYPSLNGVHAIRARIKQGTPNAAAGQIAIAFGAPAYCIGTLPKGAFVLPAAKHVITAFDGTTPTIAVGTSAVANAFLTSAQIAPAAIAFAGGLASTGMGYVVDETPVYITLTSGAGNTVGEVDILIPFYPNMD